MIMRDAVVEGSGNFDHLGFFNVQINGPTTFPPPSEMQPTQPGFDPATCGVVCPHEISLTEECVIGAVLLCYVIWNKLRAHPVCSEKRQVHLRRLWEFILQILPWIKLPSISLRDEEEEVGARGAREPNAVSVGGSCCPAPLAALAGISRAFTEAESWGPPSPASGNAEDDSGLHGVYG
ncbi:hypothetical protein HPB51_019168 [Rhipicephalus microplus]|uniref:Uncharacterized protein n=1 Tax=Rhipicephalus microplus TaxID=6941 RepID=A0A9J6DBJ4_RHIMP|nr:hypothetical protein HPB51_019168 [Rhipicephalus microplus]